MPCSQTLRRIFSLTAAAALLLTGCGEPGPSPEVLALGKEVYHRPASCVTCHQQGGLGVEGAFPPLQANADLGDPDPTALIKIVTHGLAGEIEANGQTYNAPMAGLGSRLSPEEIAAVLTYVRTSWRNTGGPVTVDQVLAVQNAHPGRTQPWTDAELRGLAPAAAAPGAAAGAAAAAASSAAALVAAAPDTEPTDDPLAWGEILYNGAAQCASCHQADGAGLAGVYPPLAGSPWVTGNTDRLIKVALHGVGGEMEVLGEVYNAEMPGQGDLLTDEQMAATLSYVRQAWGNTATPVYPDQVAKLRKKFQGRHEPWDAAGLAKIDEKSPLTNLRYRHLEVSGEPKTLKDLDLDALPVLDEGPIDDGFITERIGKTFPAHGDLALAVMVFDAEFEAPAEDQYTYSIESSGGAVLWIDGERVAGREVMNGYLRAREQVLLAPGPHTLRLVTTSSGNWRMIKISAQAESVNRARHRLSRLPTEALQVEDPAFMLVPERDRPIVLRGRYEGQSERGVGVGHPLRVNWAYDVYRGQITRAWRGDFVNAASRWNGRNDKYMKPAGDQAVDIAKRPLLARFTPGQGKWPDDAGLEQTAPGLTPMGYSIQDQLPVFYNQVDGVALSDTARPEAVDDGVELHRTIDAYAAETRDDLHALLAEGQAIEDRGEGVFVVDGAYRVTLAQPAGAQVHTQAGRSLLIAPATWQTTDAPPPAWAAGGLDGGPDSASRRATWRATYAWITPAP